MGPLLRPRAVNPYASPAPIEPAARRHWLRRVAYPLLVAIVGLQAWMVHSLVSQLQEWERCGVENGWVDKAGKVRTVIHQVDNCGEAEAVRLTYRLDSDHVITLTFEVSPNE